MKDDRYSRQVLFTEIREQGQRKIFQANVVIIGCGALGSVVANNLTRAGIGKITIVDRDFVELNNLQCQVLFNEEDVKQKLPKAIAAKKKLEKINSQVEIEAKVCDVNPRNVEEIIKGVDLVLDGTDNLETRFLINDACIKNGIPWIYGAVVGSTGATMNIIPEKTPCLRCIIDQIPAPGTLPTCDTVGVLNTIPSIIASLQATEALKIIVHKENINQELIYFDVWTNSFERIEVKRQPNCLTCVKKEFKTLEAEEIAWAATLCGRNAVQIVPKKELLLSFEDLKNKWSRLGKVKYNEFLLSFKIDKYEIIVFPNARVIIKGTTDTAVARSLYAKYIGT
ncbi:MAG: ThiF family adenylyltransferase [Candidatus Aminicenantia bacterium]